MVRSIDFEDVEGYLDRNYMYCKGRIRNNGESIADFVKSAVKALD